MSYQILSLKWRPLSFDQIVGQGHITQTLKNAISMDRLAQAFLFSGPRGVGKTTTARVLASTINDVDNYNECLDIIELDGASNRGIDEIREIRESVKFPPTTVKYKVYIIDEAHMLTEQAFNALLKTLEEPPNYIIFILATTDPQKMPQTILSRTQRYDFMRISSDDMIDRLKYILNEEKLEFEEDALKLISQKSDGSMRDALSMLDQIIAFSDNMITVRNIRSAIGLIDQEDIYELLYHIISQNADDAINKYNSILDTGVSSKVFIDDLCSFLNDCMLLKIDVNSKNTFLSKELKQKILKTLPFEMNDILQMINTSLKLSTQFKRIDNVKISIEVLIIEYINIINSNVTYENLKTNSPNISPDLSSIDEKPPIEIHKAKVDEVSEDKKTTENINLEQSPEAITDGITDKTKFKDNFHVVKSNWADILSQLDEKNSKLSSFLEETRLSDMPDNTLILKLDGGNDFIKKVLDTDKSIIIDIIKDICKIDLDISIEISDNTVETKNNTKDLEEEKDHPLLDDAINIFKGKIIS